jgi:hypothetical protein
MNFLKWVFKLTLGITPQITLQIVLAPQHRSSKNESIQTIIFIQYFDRKYSKLNTKKTNKYYLADQGCKY